jgi:hypothetical protein
VSSNFPKKRTNEFVLVVITNSFVPFLGEFKDTNKSFRNYLTFRKGYKIELLFADYLETGMTHLVRVIFLVKVMWPMENWLTKLIVIFKNLINMEITFNDVCETHQQKLFEIHG